MIIFLYGQDSYRSRRKLDEIIGHYKKVNKEGLSLRYFEGDDLDFDKLQDELKGRSMFKEKKLLILKDSFSRPEFKERLLEAPAGVTDSRDVIVFYEPNKVLAKDPLFIFLKREAKTQEFEPLGGQKLKTWVKKEIAGYDYHGLASEAAISKLIEFVGNDLWRAANEIQKLICYKKTKKIEPEDVKLLVTPDIEVGIFKTIDAIAARDKKRALYLVHKHLEKGDSPLYLLSMINFQFRNLLIVKDLIDRGKPYYALVKLSGLHPFVVKKSYDQARKFTLPELKKIYQKIFRVDLDIKTGRIDPETGLDLLITEI